MRGHGASNARLGAMSALAILLVALIGAAFPAAAIGPNARATQLAGAIPRPYVAPKTAVRVGNSLFVLDNHAIGRVDLATSGYAVFAGMRTVAGAFDGRGTAARFHGPWGLTSDGMDLYVADTGNHTIRKVVVATGQVTTIAGRPGQAGSADGTGAAARFNQPWGISAIKNSLWVSDRGNQTIRKLVVSTAAVTTVAGSPGVPGTADGTGTAARFAALAGITLDGPNLWIADHDRVRKLVRRTGVVTTVATVACGFVTKELVGLAFLNATLYATAKCQDDEGDGFRALFAVDPATGTVSDGPPIGYRDPVGLGDDGTHLYVTGYGTFFPTVFRVDPATGVGAEVGDYFQDGYADGQGAVARFSFAGSMVRDGANLYVVDASNQAIRKVAIATGAVTTLVRGLGGIGGLARSGNVLYVGSENTVKRVDTTTGVATTFATVGAAGDNVNGIVTDGARLYVVSANCAVYKVSLATAAVSVLAGVPRTCGYADGTGGAARFGYPGCGVCGPTDLAIDGPNLWIADYFSYRIRKVVIATRTVTTLADITALGDRPYGIAWAGGQLYAIVGQAIKRVGTGTGAVSSIAGTDGAFPLTYGGSPAAMTEIVEPSSLVVDANAKRIFFTHRTGVAVIAEGSPWPGSGRARRV